MDEAGWAQVNAVLDEAVELPPAERDTLLEARLGSQPALLGRARAILASLTSSRAFLEPLVDHIPPAPPSLTGDRFGAWQVDGLLGRGGMGSVYRVSRVDGGFEQQAALKLMHGQRAVDLARFEAERQVLARLDHPGIARLLDGGIDAEGRPWMAMERIDGQPVDQWCNAAATPLAGRVAKVLDAIEAVAAAHRMLVLHRDLKPGNVLVDAEGRVRVIDFGIAKQLDITGQTEGLLPLSAPYAAPELLTGTPPGPPVDVYGAAALLYELATGRPPIDLDGVPVALGISRVLESEPPRIADLRASTGLLAAAPIGLVEDLDAILARALRKEPADRYPTLDALAEDLRRALAGGVVTARSGDRAYRLRRALWRARWPIAASAAIFVALAGGFVATWMQKQEAVAARDAALAEEDRSEAVRQSLYLMLSDSVDTSGTDATSREVLDRTTRRIMAEFARNPAESARVLHALGEMHFYLGNYEAARDTLLPLVTSPSADIPPDTLAAARYDMAQALVQLGEIDAARPMLAMAQDYWRQDRVKWRARLIDSRLVEAQVLRATDPAGAVALLRSAMAEHDAMHGTRNRQAGVFRNNLGVNLLATGELDAARDAFRQAQAIWQATGLTESPDALNTANNLAAVETLAGRPEEAEPLFATAVRIRRQLFGGSGATAALLSNHGKVLLQLGRVDEALEQLREAVPMARQYAGEGSMGHIAALAGLADAQAANGDRAALATARQAVAATGLGRAPPPGRVMALISLARAEGLAGNRPAALAALDEAEAGLAEIGPAGARLATAAQEVRASL